MLKSIKNPLNRNRSTRWNTRRRISAPTPSSPKPASPTTSGKNPPNGTPPRWETCLTARLQVNCFEKICKFRDSYLFLELLVLSFSFACYNLLVDILNFCVFLSSKTPWINIVFGYKFFFLIFWRALLVLIYLKPHVSCKFTLNKVINFKTQSSTNDLYILFPITRKQSEWRANIHGSGQWRHNDSFQTRDPAENSPKANKNPQESRSNRAWKKLD